MMDNKGFTLVELIATIAILAVIAIISFVSINGVIDESKVNDCDNLLISIKNATKEYFSDNRYNLNNISSYMVDGNDKNYLISANVLTGSNYLSSPVTNPFDNTIDITDEIKISVTLKNDYTVDTIVIKNGSDMVVDCSSQLW